MTSSCQNDRNWRQTGDVPVTIAVSAMLEPLLLCTHVEIGIISRVRGHTDIETAADTDNNHVN